MGRYFVKFRTLNQNTLSSIIEKKIYFSKVFQLNDFDEYAVTSFGQVEEKDAKEWLKKELKKNKNLAPFYESLSYVAKDIYKEYVKDSLEKISIDEAVDKHFDVCLMTFLYSKMGFFCLSDISVFDDGNATSMMAHYAKDLQGVALVYEYDERKNTLYEIDYRNEPGKGGVCWKEIQKKLENALIFHHKTNDPSDKFNAFFEKKKNWEYEKEWRILGTPGLKSAEAYGLTLKGIFYTSRLDGSKKLLKEINEKHYGGDLKIARLHLSLKENGEFKVLDENCSVKDFLKIGTLENASNDIKTVYQDIKHYQMLMKSYQAYEDYEAWLKKQTLKQDNKLCEKFLSHLKKILISEMATIVVRLLSFNEGDVSLRNLHKRIINNEKKLVMKYFLKRVFSSNCSALKQLNMLYEQNKISSKDLEKLFEEAPSSNLEKLFKDLKDCFDEVTLKLDNTTYSF